MQKVLRISLFLVALIIALIIVLAWLFAEVLDQSTMKTAYQIWLENQTFIATIVALAAAAMAARQRWFAPMRNGRWT